MNKPQVTPLYRKVIEDLKSALDSGHYKIGDMLPSENDLCKTYSTTRMTVRLALTELTRMGYIIRQHGKRSIISEPKSGLGILSLKGATAGVGKKKLRTQILTKPRKIDWPADFFYDLSEAEKKAGVIYFTRLRYVNGSPTLYEETYIGDINLPRFMMHNLEKNSLFDTLRKFHQIEIQEGEQKIWAIEANDELAALLNTEVKKPLLHMKRRLKTNVKELFIYSVLYCNTQEYFVHDYF